MEPARHHGPRALTGREKRRRVWLLVILLILLALLAYATYYFVQNRRLPTVEIGTPIEVIEPPQYLYSITGDGKSALRRPIGVGVAQDGRVYVSDFANDRISVFTNRGRYLFSFNKIKGGTLRNPVHLWVKGDEVWVTDRRLQSVFVFNLDGTFKRTFVPKGEKKFRWTPLALAFDGDQLRVTDVGLTEKHRVHYFSADGSRTATFGRTFQATASDEEPGGFMFPNGLAVARNGDVYVSDGDNRRVQVFTREGKFKQFVDTSGIPRGIAIDSEQMLYVVDAVAHMVDIYDLKGKELTRFGGQGFGPGQFNYPNDITVDRNRRIYISDRENDQVQVWGWPVAGPPPIAAPKTPLGWLACVSPLFLLPLLLLLRKRRVVITPDFVEALVAAELVSAVAQTRRLRLVCPEEDHVFYAGRIEDDVDLGNLIEPELYSESDVRSYMERLAIEQREAVLVAMGARFAALATIDRDLRRVAVLAEIRVVDLDEFRDSFLRR